MAGRMASSLSSSASLKSNRTEDLALRHVSPPCHVPTARVLSGGSEHRQGSRGILIFTPRRLSRGLRVCQVKATNESKREHWDDPPTPVVFRLEHVPKSRRRRRLSSRREELRGILGVETFEQMRQISRKNGCALSVSRWSSRQTRRPMTADQPATPTMSPSSMADGFSGRSRNSSRSTTRRFEWSREFLLPAITPHRAATKARAKARAEPRTLPDQSAGTLPVRERGA